MKLTRSLGFVVATALGLALLTLMGTLISGTEARAQFDSHWFVSFDSVNVAPVARRNTTQLLEMGTIDTDGFSELVFSLGGEFKEGVPSSGRLGAVLIPDVEVFDFLLRNEGEFVFPLEVTYEVGPLNSAIFISPQQTARIAFPRYRVYLYNETTSGASVVLYVYRTRR
jgi:hypothetical protein